jgi:hypothetical protein
VTELECALSELEVVYTATSVEDYAEEVFVQRNAVAAVVRIDTVGMALGRSRNFVGTMSCQECMGVWGAARHFVASWVPDSWH